MADRRRVVLSLLTLAPPGAPGARVSDVETAEHLLDVFQKRGYTEVETAHSYAGGQQHAFTGRLAWRKRGLVLSTKFYPRAENRGAEPAVFRTKVEQTLRDLKTEQVDTFYIHGPERSRPIAPTLKCCDDMYREGKFKRLGLSNFAAYEVAEIVMTCHANGWIRPTVYQGMYSCLTRAIEPELVAACRRYGLNILAYTPLAGGLLTDGIRSLTDLQNRSGSRFHDSSPLKGPYAAAFCRESQFAAVASIATAAKERGLTVSEVAFRWLVHHSALNMKQNQGQDSGKDGLIIGVSTEGHLIAALDDLEKGPLDEGLVKILDDAWDSVKTDTPTYWHGELKYQYDTTQAIFGGK